MGRGGNALRTAWRASERARAGGNNEQNQPHPRFSADVPVQNVTIFQRGKDVTYVQAWANVFSNMLLEVKSDSATLARAA